LQKAIIFKKNMGKILINERQLEILTEHVLFEQEIDSTISEQKRMQIGKNVVSGEPSKGEPLHIAVDREAKYAVNDDKADSVGGAFFWPVIRALELKFPYDKETNPEGWKQHKDKILLKKVTIRSGASNFYKGASTAASVMNDRVTPMPKLEKAFDMGSGTEIGTYPLPYYEDNEVIIKWDKNSQPYKDNLDLARRRGENFLVWIKENLKANGLLILEPMEKEDVVPYVVDTGGVVDNKRDENVFPNPGQFLTMELELGSDGVLGKEKTECLIDMNIFVGYYENGTEISDGKTSTTNHNCDAAIFNVYLNKEYVFTANLNNRNDPDVGDSKKHRKKSSGKNRVCGMTIDNKLAQKILSTSETKDTIEVGIKGMVEGGGKDTGEPATYKGEEINPRTTVPTLHADVPLVTLKWGDGQKWSGTPNTELRRGDTSYKKIMSFDVCKQEVDA